MITIDTDVEGSQFKSIEKIADKFPFAGQVEGQLKQRLEGGDVSYEDDVKPLLGQRVRGGGHGRRRAHRARDSDTDEFVGAIQVKDKGKLEELIKKEGRGEGRELRREDLRGRRRRRVRDRGRRARGGRQPAAARRGAGAARRRRSADRGQVQQDRRGAARGGAREGRRRPPDADRVRPGHQAGARKVPWVDALRTFGATLSFTDDSAEVDFKLGTDGGDLSDEEIPLATGAESPGVLDLPNEIGVGLRDPAQLFRFGESAAQAVDPDQYADYQTGKAAAERRLGIDIDEDLIAQLEGDASLSVSTRGDVGVRIELADEAKFSDTLEKLEKELPRFISSTGGSPTRLTRAGDVTVLRSADGDNLAYKVEDGALLLSNRPRAWSSWRARSPTRSRARRARWWCAPTRRSCSSRRFAAAAARRARAGARRPAHGRLAGSAHRLGSGVQGRHHRQVRLTSTSAARPSGTAAGPPASRRCTSRRRSRSRSAGARRTSGRCCPPGRSAGRCARSGRGSRGSSRSAGA